MWEQNQEAMKKGLNDADSIIEAYNMLMEDAKEKRAEQEAQKAEQEGRKEAASGKYQAKLGYTEEGLAVYTSNFPEGSTRKERQDRILELVQNVWSKSPIRLEIIENGNNRVIEAQFDPYVDPDKRVNSDATKLAYGNRKGTMSDQKTTEKLADDFPEIIASSSFVKPKQETGKTTAPHQGVTVWNYFANHIGFVNEKGGYAEYNVNVDVKHKDSGHYVYSFAAEKVKGSERSKAPILYGDPKTILASGRGIAPAIANTIIPESAEKSNGKYSLQSEQTETPEFKRWFGESEVVDEDGHPLAVYHTTNSDFTVFDREKLGANSKTASQFLQATAYTGFWFNTASVEHKTGGNAKKVYLSAKRLYEAGTLEGLSNDIWDTYSQFDYNEYSGDPDEAEEKAAGEFFAAWLQSRGYDGIVLEDEEFGGTSYVVFEPTQIKSATDNVGTFDPENPDIRYSLQDTSPASLDEALMENAALRKHLEQAQEIISQRDNVLAQDQMIDNFLWVVYIKKVRRIL